MRTTVRESATPGEQGFTLLEVLVSLAIMSVVLTSLSVFFVRSMSSVNQQGDRQAAVQLASDGMERMREVPGSLVKAWLTDKAPESLTVNNITYTRTWDVPRVVSTAPAPSLVYAVVRVAWRGNNCAGNVCQYASTTLVATAVAEPVFDPDRP
jgi:prepilin-type N-terminal cleavage/methylation domain-containing protein